MPPLDETLSASLEAYKRLINRVGCIVWEGDPQTYAFTFVSEEAARVLGYPTQRWVDEPTFWADHIHPEDRARVLGLCQGETTMGRSHEFEYRMVAADGRVVWLKDIVSVITEGGRAVWSQGVMVDITERKALELALEAQNERLRELDVFKRELIGTASHELRTPLASIQGFAELLEDDAPLTPRQRTFVDGIMRSADRLGAMVENLLDVARAESGELALDCREGDMRAVVAGVVESLGPQSRQSGVTLELAPGGPVRLPFDDRRIEQVLLNFLSNALKFTPPGGRVTATIAETPAGARVEVADNGIGLAPAHQARVFEKFFQVDTSSTRPYGGSGLGLAIARLLVTAHGGAIGVTETPGGGSTFWFTLPR
jgi:PAS domain S-box-containing protein